MSLAIDINKVSDVLLADGWHHVEFAKGKSTFVIDAYDFVEQRGEGSDPVVHASGGTVGGVVSTGAEWLERESGESGKSYVVTCPLTSILALKRFIPPKS
jgi:hypothetical protein